MSHVPFDLRPKPAVAEGCTGKNRRKERLGLYDVYVRKIQ